MHCIVVTTVFRNGECFTGCYGPFDSAVEMLCAQQHVERFLGSLVLNGTQRPWTSECRAIIGTIPRAFDVRAPAQFSHDFRSALASIGTYVPGGAPRSLALECPTVRSTV